MSEIRANSMADKMRKRRAAAGPTLSDIEAYEIPLENIRVETQVRKDIKDEDIRELAESIKNEGLIQPIILEQADSGYTIIVGERRYRAAQFLGWKEIPAIIKARSNKNRMFTQLIENIHREDLHPVEVALAVKEIKADTGLKDEEIGEKVGKQKAYVSKCTSIAKLTQKVPPQELYGISFEVLYQVSTKIGEANFRALLEKAKSGVTVKEMKDLIDVREIKKEQGLTGKIKKVPPIRIKEVIGGKDLRINLSIGQRLAARLDDTEKSKLTDQVGRISKQLTELIPGGAKIGVTITMESRKERTGE